MYRKWMTLPNGTEIYQHTNGVEYRALTTAGDLIHVIGKRALDNLIERQKNVKSRRVGVV